MNYKYIKYNIHGFFKLFSLTFKLLMFIKLICNTILLDFGACQELLTKNFE